ncbi:MAG: flavin-containing monooxygenase [Cumulibacter sp.]
MSTTEQDTEFDFDVEELRAKYRHERDRRMREDGSDQFHEMVGAHLKYHEHDPFADPSFTRDPVTADVEVLIIGAGFSGLLASARLIQQGIEDFQIVEAGADFGGTWYWNRYPGAQCDTEAYMYLPLLEELGYMPKEKYAYGTEIIQHASRVGEHFGLYERAHFQTRVRGLHWDEEAKRWIIETDRGDELRAQFVITAIGPASRARLPGIDGIDDFEGHSFHTSRWDYNYTGGDTTGGMSKLNDKKVAIIGTGATAVQVIPRVAQDAEHLYVFQRTPSAVAERMNKATDPDWFASLEPGWQRKRRANFEAIRSFKPVEEDLIQDGWTRLAAKLRSMGDATDPEQAREMFELADFWRMEEIRNRVAEVVTNPQAAEALKPYYKFFCKRPTFNDEFLPAFNRDNVELIDVSDAKGIDRITRKGVVANGKEYEVDCIVYASGFELTSKFSRRISFDVLGRDGQSLVQEWSTKMRTLHGFMSRGYPNWFYIGLTQNAFSVNMTAMFDEQAQHIAYIIAETKRRGGVTIEPTEQAQEAWFEEVQQSQFIDTYYDDCTPGYFNDEGRSKASRGTGRYGAGFDTFNQTIEDWRNEGSMAGMEIRKES